MKKNQQKDTSATGQDTYETREVSESTATSAFVPDILAPAGDSRSFLAAVSAGADAVYAGLKHFSARMEAGNFSTSELAAHTALAREHGCKVYVPFNTLVKPGDAPAVGRLLDRLERVVKPAGIIVQDLGAVALAKEVGFSGEIHLSTLANVSNQAALGAAHDLGAQRVVLPRELSIDEIRLMDAAAPQGLDFEVFIHGALCFCVSGRCYWSSYMGGKSGLRGRCVQPCRRVYTQKSRKGRFFSCQDLGLDVLVKALLDIPRVKAWKIEGRKKGPHYVFHTVAAYRMLRDQYKDPAARREAQNILEHALGRPSTHYGFLPQRAHSPVENATDEDTGSGMLAAKVAGNPDGSLHINPRFDLIKGDLLRVGHQDQPWHKTVKVTKRVPKRGRLDLKFKKQRGLAPGAPVYLIDRQEPELIALLRGLETELGAHKPGKAAGSNFTPKEPVIKPYKQWPKGDMKLMRTQPTGKHGKHQGVTGLWLSTTATERISRTLYDRIWWWLPPVVWPDEEGRFKELLNRVRRAGARNFVCNQPWQAALFQDGKKPFLMAGPFCNTANAQALHVLASMGFSSAIVSPELSGEDYLALPEKSPMPLGIVIQGYWPLGVSRIAVDAVKQVMTFESPKKELHWQRRYGNNTWLYPAWPMDLTAHRPALEKAGFSLFVTIKEPTPKDLPPQNRPGDFNWDLRLL